MSARQQFAQATTSVISGLEEYIRKVGTQSQHGNMTTQLRRLEEALFELQNIQLKAADDSPALRAAVVELTQANAQIDQQIKAGKDFQEKVETVAAIAELVEKAITLAVA
jgi:hypothetical protein